MEAGKLESKERLFDNDNLAPIEHLLVGSSIQIDGKLWSADTFWKNLEEVPDGEKDVLPKRLLIPTALSEGKKTEKQVSFERTKKGKLPLHSSILDYDQLIEGWMRQGIQLYFEIGELDQDGQIKTEWKLKLLDLDSNEFSCQDLRIRTDFEDYFSLEKDGGKGMVLRFNLK